MLGKELIRRFPTPANPSIGTNQGKPRHETLDDKPLEKNLRTKA